MYKRFGPNQYSPRLLLDHSARLARQRAAPPGRSIPARPAAASAASAQTDAVSPPTPAGPGAAALRTVSQEFDAPQLHQPDLHTAGHCLPKGRFKLFSTRSLCCYRSHSDWLAVLRVNLEHLNWLPHQPRFLAGESVRHQASLLFPKRQRQEKKAHTR